MVEDIHRTAIDPNGCPGPLKTANTTNPVCSFNLFYILHILGIKNTSH